MFGLLNSLKDLRGYFYSASDSAEEKDLRERLLAEEKKSPVESDQIGYRPPPPEYKPIDLIPEDNGGDYKDIEESKELLEDETSARTISSEIPRSVYVLSLINTMRGCLPVPLFLIYFKKDIFGDKNPPLRCSIPVFFGIWFFSIFINFWMTWNSYKDRLTEKLDLKYLMENTELEEGTLYFFFLYDQKELKSILHYAIIIKNKIEIKSLNNLRGDIQETIKRKDIQLLNQEECNQLKRFLDPNHKPILKSDAPLTWGDQTDRWLFIKCLGSTFLPSATSGALLGLAFTENASLIIKIALAIAASHG